MHWVTATKARFQDTSTLARPSLEIAIWYEVIFRIPVSELFAGMRDATEEAMEDRSQRGNYGKFG